MPRLPQAPAPRCLALAGAAALAALISNSLASPARHLAWRGSVIGQPASTPQIQRPAVALPSPPLPAVPDTRPSRSDHPVPPIPRSGNVPPETKAEATVASTPIREISGEEAWQAFEAGTPFLDARRSAEFTEGHIAGAWCAPVWESDLDDRLISFKASRRPGPEDPIVIYCSGGDCRDSHLLAAKLLNEGYFHLLIYRGGFPDWLTHSHPVDRGQP